MLQGILYVYKAPFIIKIIPSVATIIILSFLQKSTKKARFFGLLNNYLKGKKQEINHSSLLRSHYNTPLAFVKLFLIYVIQR